jgi:hypothetical protein
VSGVEAEIHCGDERWIGVGMDLSERDQNLASYKYGEKWTRSPFGIYQNFYQSDPFSSEVKSGMSLKLL